MSAPPLSPYHAAIEEAYFAAANLMGALLAARTADDPSEHLALISMERAMCDGAQLIAAMKRAGDLVQAAQPVNDRTGAPVHAA
ncbi:MAG: hypothetical protein KJZ75_11465 [Hyphomonadaceae bacterium]|nr:hypothetical protein [Hyphomonadaceae bacterium]